MESAGQAAPQAGTGQSPQHDIAGHAHALHQVELLEDHADTGADAADVPADTAVLLHDLVIDPHQALTLVCGGQTADVTHERGFAGTGRADEGHHLSRGHMQVDVRKAFAAAERFIEIADVDHANAPVEVDWLTMGKTHGETVTRP